MENVDLMGIIEGLSGMGRWGWIAAAVVSLFAVLFYGKYKQMMKELAAKKTQEEKAKDLAETVGENERIEDKWDEAASEIDKIRAEESKKNQKND